MKEERKKIDSTQLKKTTLKISSLSRAKKIKFQYILLLGLSDNFPFNIFTWIILVSGTSSYFGSNTLIYTKNY